MIHTSTRATRTDTLWPDTTLIRSATATQISAVQKRRFALRPMVTLPILLSQLFSIILCKTVGKSSRKAQCLCRWFAGLRDDGAQQVADAPRRSGKGVRRSEENTSELQSLMRISYAVFCFKTTIHQNTIL